MRVTCAENTLRVAGCCRPTDLLKALQKAGRPAGKTSFGRREECFESGARSKML